MCQSQIFPSLASAIEMTNEARHRLGGRNRCEASAAVGGAPRASVASSIASRPRIIAETTDSGGPTSRRMFWNRPAA